MKKYFVYILQCADNSYYTGITNNTERRLWEHNNLEDTKGYTYSRRPVMLVYQEEFIDVNHAIAWEKQVKGWSRAKKAALINGEWDSLPALAACKNESSHKNKID